MKNSLRVKVKKILSFFLLLSLGQLFLYNKLIQPLKLEIGNAKNAIIEHNQILEKELICRSSFEEDNKNIVSTPSKFILPNIPSTLDSESIKHLNLERVKTMEVEVNEKEIRSDNLEAYYYIISVGQKPVKVVANLCYDKAKVKKRIASNPSATPNGVIVTTFSNKTIRTNHLNINKESLNDKGEWKIVLCDDNGLDKDVTLFIKHFLKLHGYDVSDSDMWDAQEQLYSYQEENDLPIGNINFETLENLGFKIYMGKK